MPTTRRGSDQYSATTGTSHNVPLPSGSVAGDWVVLAVSAINTAFTLTLPGTSMFASTVSNTMTYAASKKQLTSTDITNGYLTFTTSSAQNVTAVIVGYSESDGFATPGTVTAKPGSQATTSAVATGVTSDGTQDILVFSLLKHSGNPQTFTGNSPATTTLQTVIQNGSGVPSAHVGVYTGSAATRTSTWGVSSANGVGFQIAVTPSAGITGTVTADSPTVTAAVPTLTWSGTVSEPSGSGAITASTPTVTVAVPTVALAGTVSAAVTGRVGIHGYYSPSDPTSVTIGSERLAGSVHETVLYEATTELYRATVTHDGTTGWGAATFTGLSAGTEYQVRFEVDGAEQTDAELRVRVYGAATLSYTVVAGSCQFTASNHPVFDAILAEDPAFVSHMGDLHYQDATNAAGWRSGMHDSLTTARMQTLQETVPLYWTPDNHDRIITNEGGTGSNLGTTDPLTASQWKQLTGTSGWASSGGLGKTWVVGRVRYIQTDNWTERTDPDAGATPDTFLGATQKAWWKSTLEAATEPVIVWFCGWTARENANGRWASFPTETAELEAWLNARPTIKSRMILIGGDSHSLQAGDGDYTGGDGQYVFQGMPSLNISGFNRSGDTGDLSGGWNIANEPVRTSGVEEDWGSYSRITIEDDGTSLDFTWDGVRVNSSGVSDVMATFSRTYSLVAGSVDAPTPSVTVAATTAAWSGTATVPVFVATLTADAPGVAVEPATAVWSGTVTPPVFTATLVVDLPAVAVATPLATWSGSSIVPVFMGTVGATLPTVTVSVAESSWAGTVASPGVFVGAIDASLPSVTIRVLETAWAGSYTDPSSGATLDATTPQVNVDVPALAWSGSVSVPTFTGALIATAPAVAVQTSEAAWAGTVSVPIYTATLNAILPLLNILTPVWEQSAGEPVPFPDVGTLVLSGPSRTLGLTGPVRTLEWST